MNFAIIGNGRISKEYQKVLDFFAVKYEVFGRGVRPYDNKDGRYSAIIIAVTWTETEKVLEQMLEFNIPILIEKPVSLNSNSLLQLIVQNDTSNCMVAYNRRFYKFMDYLRQELKTNTLISCDMLLPEPIEKYKKQGVKQLDKYPLLYSGSHYLDLLLYLTGRQEVVYQENDTVFGTIQALLRNDYGAITHFQTNFNTPNMPRMNFYFKDRTIILSPLETLIVCNDIVQDEQGMITPNISHVESEYMNNEFKYGFLEQMRYFIDVFVKKKREDNKHCNLQQALEVVKLSEKLTGE